MQIDLALFLRLSRTLERTRTAADTETDSESEVLGALDGFLLTLEERGELLRTRQPVAPEAISIEVESIEESTAEPPEIPEESSRVPETWTREHDLLYEDILWLFKIGDNEGALVSLGRLVTVAYDTPELKRFLEINESKLTGLYEKILGNFDKPYVISGNGVGDRFFWNPDDVRQLLESAKTKTTLAELLAESPLPQLKTLSIVHRLHTERMIQLEGVGKSRVR